MNEILIYHPKEIGYVCSIYPGAHGWHDIPRVGEIVDVRCMDGSKTIQHGRVVAHHPDREEYDVIIVQENAIQPGLF